MSDPALNPFNAVARLLEDAGVIPPDPAKRVEIAMGGEISFFAEQVGLALGKQPKLFLRGDTVMKIEYDANIRDLDFVPMKETEFVSWVEKYVRFFKNQRYTEENEEGDEVVKFRKVTVSLIPATARLILDAPQFRACLPRVMRKNRVRLPVIRPGTKEHPKGKLELLPTGFDEATGVFTFPSPVQIDESWTVDRAIAFEKALYGEFPLPLVAVTGGEGEQRIEQCPRALGACIGSQVAIFAESLLPEHTIRCGFIFTANEQGSGKTMMGKIASAPILGRAEGLTYSKDEEALRSRVDTALLSGEGVIFFDNVKGYIESQVIEALMTLPFWKGRVYHTQRMFTVRNETTVLISGNNATPSPDLQRRFVFIELFKETHEERPLSREIDDVWLMQVQNRSDILSALWAIVRNWDECGRPGAPKIIPGFKSWSDVVGGIVSSLTERSGGAIGNPLVNPELITAGNKEIKHMKRLVELLLTEELRRRVVKTLKAEGSMVVDELTTEQLDHCAEVRGMEVDAAEFTPAAVVETAMTHGLFDWFLPELPEGKEASDVLKQPERVKFGKLLTTKSAEHPRGVKYLVATGDRQTLWRLSWQGSGRHRKYLLSRE